MVLLCLVSCRDDVQRIEGTYSYKISGSAMLDSTEVPLRTEVGSMEIIHVTSEGALATFNALNGDVYYTTMHVIGKNLYCGYSRNVSVLGQDYEVRAEGEGYVYGETLLFSLRYYNEDHTFEADSLILLCKKN